MVLIASSVTKILEFITIHVLTSKYLVASSVTKMLEFMTIGVLISKYYTIYRARSPQYMHVWTTMNFLAYIGWHELGGIFYICSIYTNSCNKQYLKSFKLLHHWQQMPKWDKSRRQWVPPYCMHIARCEGNEMDIFNDRKFEELGI